MNPDNKTNSSDNSNAAGNDNSDQEKIRIPNPFKKGEDKEVTKEELDNIEKFKEAQTERD
jgi:hypothetical protein